ncbi:MAG TPA: hypothetical protein VKX16_16670 [Chloroflexota bacterium]|nr:hypothetical protein [Chloroflexota bacterium]
MVWNRGDIQPGMEVFALDGRKLGVVSEVVPDTPRELIAGALGAGESGGAGPARDERIVDRPGHFVVTGEGSPLEQQKLHIPFSAVQILFPGENVTVSWASDQCIALYGAPAAEAAPEVTAGA